MATLDIDGSDLVVRLSAIEKIGALRGDIRVPLASVRAVRVSDTPWSELRGIRWPGTGLPGVISLCTRRGPGVHDFAAVYCRRPALVIELTGASFDRLVISCADAGEAAAHAGTSAEPPAWAHAQNPNRTDLVPAKDNHLGRARHAGVQFSANFHEGADDDY